jgi:peroxiredoxin
MLAAGVMNYRQRRRAEQARIDAMKINPLQLVNSQGAPAAAPDSGANAAADDAAYSSPLNGSQAPNFTLEDLSGKPVSLASFRGKPLVVDFWATWCEPCKVEIPWFEKLHDQYAGQGLEILGVSTDDLDRNDPARLFTEKRDISDFVAKMRMNYPVLLGADSVEDRWQIDATPTTFFIDRTGRIVASAIGLTPRDEIEADIQKAIRGAAL